MDNNIDIIAYNIKTVREEQKKSQDEFAKSLNLKRNSITLIETGKRNASDRTIKDICKTYKISEEWLRTGKGEMHRVIDEEDAQYAADVSDIFKETDKFRRKMYTVLKNLDDTSWEVLEKFLKEITKE